MLFDCAFFKIVDGQITGFKNLCEQFVARASKEERCLYYGFSFKNDEAYCREGYRDAEGVLMHLANVDDLLQQALDMAEIIRSEIHGPEEELKKLYEPLAKFNPQFFILEYGFRR